MAACVQVKDATPGDSGSARGPGPATADSAAGAVGGVPAAPPSGGSPNVAFGPDSATRIRGGPLWTPEAIAAIQNDTMFTLPEIDTTGFASDGSAASAPPTPARPGAPKLSVTPSRPSAPVTPAPVSPSTPAPNAATLMFAMPVAGVKATDLRDTYTEKRGGGSRTHEALDIPAARGTPVVSAAPGRVLKLFNSKAGGLMVYAADSSQRFILMYAHLDAYAPGLAEGQTIGRGQVLGTVGTTGNAPPTVPHLHFAIASTSNVNEWWKGDPVNPFPLLVR